MYALLDQGLSWAAVGERMGCSKGCIAGKVKRLADRPRPPPVVVAPPPPRLPSPRSCQYPYGDPGEPGFRFCEAPVWRGVYCRACHAVCYGARRDLAA